MGGQFGATFQSEVGIHVKILLINSSIFKFHFIDVL